MKTCIRLLSLILTLPVFSQTDGDDIVIGLSQFAECHAAYGRFEKDIFSIGIEKAVRNFKKTKASGENKLTYNENDLNTLGYTLMNRHMNAEAIKVFKLALEIYPESANLYDSLGEAYVKNGDNRNAIINYEKSLDLNPANINAKGMLERLKNKK